MKQTIETADKPVAYLYGRCSSVKQADGDSERRQWQDGESIAAQHGFTLADERFFDAGVSAYRGANLTEKAKLGMLLERLQPGQGLIFENMDRFSRQDWFTAAKAFERFLAKGVKVIVNRQAVTLESFQRDPGSFLPVIMASHLGHDEDRKKSERVKAAWVTKRAEIKAGVAIRQRLPGWLFRETTQTPDGKVIMGGVKVNESRATTVRQIFTWALEGWGRRRIAQKLNGDKVPTVSGQSDKWHAESLNICILRNRAVIGDYTVLDAVTGKPTGEIAKGIFPAIVSEREFYAVQAVRTQKAQRSSPVRQASNCLVTGLTKCPTCNGPMEHHSNHKGDGKVYKYLVCQNNKAGKATNPECKRRISYTEFEASLLTLMSDSTRVRKALGQPVVQADALAELRGRLAAADKLSEDYQKGFETVTPTPKMLAAWQKADAQAETLRAELQKQEAQLKATTPPQVAYDNFRAELANLSEQPAGREKVKAALRDVVDNVQFHSTGATVEYTVTFKGGSRLGVRMCGKAGAWSKTQDLGRVVVP